MESDQVVGALSALAQEHRLALFRLLVQVGAAGMPAGVIADRLGLPNSSLSFHLGHLTRAGLIRQRREGRSLIYSADYEAMNALIAFLTENCCNGAPCGPGSANFLHPAADDDMGTRIYNVLFLCTGNSARSILAEAILNREGQGHFRAFSAGSVPKGAVHPRTLDILRSLGHPTDELRSKSWDEFAGSDAPKLDFVFTVCDNAAGETCPIWPGQPMTAHWGIPDPAAVDGSPAEQHAAFYDAYRMLFNRIKIFTSLPFDGLDRLSLQQKLKAIGEEGTPANGREVA